MFKKAKWIWLHDEAPDTYADFISDFTWSGGRTELRISADSNYAAYINGKLVGFGQYADFPENKIGDVIDVTEYLKKGENRLAVIVWYYGRYMENISNSPLTYICGDAGVIFEVEEAGEIVAASSAATLCRPDPGYYHGKKEVVTWQLGLTFRRDMLNADDSFLTGGNDGFAQSRETGSTLTVSKRPIKMLTLGERQPAKLMRAGVFEYPENAETQSAAQNMQFASIAYRSLKAVSDKARGHMLSPDEPVKIKADGGIFVMIDLMRESVGFLDIDVEVPCDTRIDIGWGEHLYDGVCRTFKRNFTVTVDAKAGRNSYMNPFRRFGGRYFQLFIHSNEATVNYVGLRPTDYPVTVKPYDCGNLLRNTVYETSVATLRLNMHEHYEDCPWREQGLYTMDSRNQMLCGYYAFGEYEFPRASLHLIGESITENGLLPTCAPTATPLYLPSFSLAYFMQMREYIEYSGDKTLAEEMYGTLSRIMNVFTSRIDETGMIHSFGGDGVFFNFYEWSPTVCGDFRHAYTGYEAALNLLLALAMGNFAAILRYIGKDGEADALDKAREKLLCATTACFWDEKAGLMRTRDDFDSYSVLVNSLALLTGAIDGKDVTNVLGILVGNGKNPDGTVKDGIVPNTLSMNCFRFDALLRFDRERYKNEVLDELDRTYLMMLREGATSFWETELGEYDFDEAGSLCHGWAALPIYYYSTLL